MFTGLHQNNVHYCDLITPLLVLISTLHLRRGGTLWSAVQVSIFGHPVLAWTAKLNWTEDRMTSPECCEAQHSLSACGCTSIHGQFFLVSPDRLMKQKSKCSTDSAKSMSDWPTWVTWSVLCLRYNIHIQLYWKYLKYKKNTQIYNETLKTLKFSYCFCGIERAI